MYSHLLDHLVIHSIIINILIFMWHTLKITIKIPRYLASFDELFSPPNNRQQQWIHSHLAAEVNTTDKQRNNSTKLQIKINNYNLRFCCSCCFVVWCIYIVSLFFLLFENTLGNCQVLVPLCYWAVFICHRQRCAHTYLH